MAAILAKVSSTHTSERWDAIFLIMIDIKDAKALKPKVKQKDNYLFPHLGWIAARAQTG